MMTGQKYRFGLLLLLLLAGCAKGGAEDPSIVLDRASAQAQQLQSAAFDAAFSYDAASPRMRVDGTAKGSLADGGQQLSFTLTGDITMQATDGPDQTVSVNADIVVAGEGEAYVRVHRADGSVLMLPGVGLLPDSAVDRWIRLGGGSGSGATTLTPDPSFIALQTQTLTVVKDRSYESVDGFRCYTYDVAIDREKLLSFLERVSAERGEAFDRVKTEAFLNSYEATGTIWIDAKTSVIRRISWRFEHVGDGPSSSATLSLHLQAHNEPVTITPPADASTLKDVLPGTALPAY